MNNNPIKTKIITAALQEFAANGYAASSTNTICKKAGVAKGTVFLHFPTKANLYYHVFVHCAENLMRSYEKQDFQIISDSFERLMAISFWKMEYFNLHPDSYKVMKEIITDPPGEIASLVYAYSQKMMDQSTESFFVDSDFERFSDEYNREEILLFFRIALEGLQSMYLDHQLMQADFDQYKEKSLIFINIVLKGMKK